MSTQFSAYFIACLCSLSLGSKAQDDVVASVEKRYNSSDNYRIEQSIEVYQDGRDKLPIHRAQTVITYNGKWFSSVDKDIEVYVYGDIYVKVNHILKSVSVTLISDSERDNIIRIQLTQLIKAADTVSVTHLDNGNISYWLLFISEFKALNYEIDPISQEVKKVTIQSLEAVDYEKRSSVYTKTEMINISTDLNYHNMKSDIPINHLFQISQGQPLTLKGKYTQYRLSNPSNLKYSFK